MDTLTVTCPGCRQQLRLPEGLVGELVKCPACNQAFPAPDVPEAVPIARSPAPPARLFAPPEVEQAERGHPPFRSPRVVAISIMTLVGGIVAILCALFWAMSIVGLLWPGTYYSLVLGILATVKGARLLGDQAWREPPPTSIAVMQIINVVALDLINLVLGILTLVFLHQRDARNYFRG